MVNAIRFLFETKNKFLFDVSSIVYDVYEILYRSFKYSRVANTAAKKWCEDINVFQFFEIIVDEIRIIFKIANF